MNEVSHKKSLLFCVGCLITFLSLSLNSISQIANWLDQTTIDDYSNQSKKPHDYNYETKIFDLNPAMGQTLDYAYKVFISDSRFVASTVGNQQVVNGGTLFLKLALPGINLPGLHPIKTVLNPSQHMVTNYTLEGHALHHGKVERKLIEKNNAVYLVTHGVGYSEIESFLTEEEIKCDNDVKLLKTAVFSIGKLFMALNTQLKDLNENPCIHDYIWGPVDNAFVSAFIPTFSPTLNQPIGYTVLDKEAIWAETFNGLNKFDNEGKLIKDGPNNSVIKTEIFKVYNYTQRNIQKSFVLFYSYNYFNGSKAICHACYPRMSAARFVNKNNLWYIEEFIETFEGTTGAWGDGPRLSFVTLNGHAYMKTVINEMADPKEADIHYYNLDTFKEEIIK